MAQLMLHLAKRYRIGLVYLRGPGAEPLEDVIRRACETVTEVVPRREKRAGGRMHRRDVLLAPMTGMPSPVAAMYDPGLEAASRTAIAEWRPDIVQVEHDNIAYLGPAIRRMPGEPGLVLICHEPGLLAAEDQARATRGRQRLAHRIDVSAWRRYWARNLEAFDVVVTFTDRDRAIITAAHGNIRSVAIPLGIDIPDEPAGAAERDEPIVLFVGGYSHPPNSDAAMRLLEAIMPTVRRELPGLRLVLAGADPVPGMLSAAGPDDTVTGTVPDVRPFMDQATLLALPIRLGGGMRVKLLEALAAGKAIVTSRLAAAGLELTDGAEVVFAESDSDFAAAIVRLVGDRDERLRLGAAARSFAEENLGWDARAREYESLYTGLREPAAN